MNETGVIDTILADTVQPYCRAEMHAGRAVCCPRRCPVSMPTGQIDRRMPDRYITQRWLFKYFYF